MSLIQYHQKKNPKIPPKLQLQYPVHIYNLKTNLVISQQSLPPSKLQTFYPFADISKKFQESLEKCRKHPKGKLKINAIERTTISKRFSNDIISQYKKTRYEFDINNFKDGNTSRRASELVDQLLLDIYGRGCYNNKNKLFETDYGSSTSFKSHEKFDRSLQCSHLESKDVQDLKLLLEELHKGVKYTGHVLIKQLKKKDALKSKQEKICNVITASLQAYSSKTSDDTNMRFTPNPTPGDSGFNQWRDAMKMVAKLPGGIPPDFRRKLWIALAEKHLQSKGINWPHMEKICFNEWSNPDDSELGVQIVKDLHRTGCSLFCGTAGQENQALLKRVLLAYARWNKSVGYCQGFNMLAALILQVMDKNETDSVKVMIYLIEGVLPESYFANNLRGLSVDMIVFRDLLKIRLPKLSRHLEMLQNDAREGNSYEPPLTNVFTMQWFLTLFCNCLPQATVLRVWDLIFLEGNEILLRTAIAIWEKLSDRILAVNSADEFYSIMGVLTREMLEFGLVDSNTLIKSVVAIGTCAELNDMRDRYLYNITPWTQTVQSAAKKGFKLFYSDDDDTESDFDEKAAVTAAYGISVGRKKDKQQSSTGSSVIQPYAHGHPDRERLALDISALKKQYAKLRERQRQAHIILQAACARQPIGQSTTSSPIAMNHLLLGKNAIAPARGRRLGPPKGSIPPPRVKETIKNKQSTVTSDTIYWKDTEKCRRRQSMVDEETSESAQDKINPESDSSSYSDDDTSSTSTELCDEAILETEKTLKDCNNTSLVEKLPTDSTQETNVNIELSKLGKVSETEVVPSPSEFSNVITNLTALKTLKTIDINNRSDNNTSDSLLCRKNITDGYVESSADEIKYEVCSDDSVGVEFDNDRIDIFNEQIVEEQSETHNDNFEMFLEERLKILKENSEDSIASLKTDFKTEDRLKRHRSYEETTSYDFEKTTISKQNSFDIGILPTIETSLWTPIRIEEESPKEEINTKELLSVEHNRLETGRRNSERALKIIQENSLILHRILQQQRSSEKEDSEEELSRSPISKTFLRSESLLSKDERTDEERSSRDGEDLGSGGRSLSVSPAFLDEDSEKNMKRGQDNEDGLSSNFQIQDKGISVSSLLTTFEDSEAVLAPNLQTQEELTPVSSFLKTFEENNATLTPDFQIQENSNLGSSLLSRFDDNAAILTANLQTQEEITPVSPFLKTFEENNVNLTTDFQIQEKSTLGSSLLSRFDDNAAILTANLQTQEEITPVSSFLKTFEENNVNLTPDFQIQENSTLGLSLLSRFEDNTAVLAPNLQTEEEFTPVSPFLSKLEDFRIDRPVNEPVSSNYPNEDWMTLTIEKNNPDQNFTHDFISVHPENLLKTALDYQTEDPEVSSVEAGFLNKFFEQSSNFVSSNIKSKSFEDISPITPDTSSKVNKIEEIEDTKTFSSKILEEYCPNFIMFEGTSSEEKEHQNNVSSVVNKESPERIYKFSSQFLTSNLSPENKNDKDAFLTSFIEKDYKFSSKFQLYEDLSPEALTISSKQIKIEENSDINKIYSPIIEDISKNYEYSRHYKDLSAMPQETSSKQADNSKNDETISSSTTNDNNFTVEHLVKEDVSNFSYKFKERNLSCKLEDKIAKEDELETYMACRSPGSDRLINKLSLDLKSSNLVGSAPEISPSKNLSCLQFSSFNPDIPCSSKSIHISPICSKEQVITQQNVSPSKTSPKYFKSFNLPTLSPPRRSLTSPLSPNRTFSPFPVQPTTRQPKELGVKLGMYKDTNPLSPSKQ